MKRFLVGCLVVLALGMVALGVGAYFLYRAASPVIQNARDYLGRLTELGELESRVVNKSAFTPPASGELTQEQVDRFVRVQERVRSSLGQRFNEIEAKYRDLKGVQGTREPTFSELISGLGDLANIFVEARRFQVDALNQEGFSSSEYRWVRTQVYRAAGVEVTSAVDFEKIAEAARKGTGIEDIKVPETPVGNVPAQNRELVKPHISKLDQWLPLAFFGL